MVTINSFTLIAGDPRIGQHVRQGGRIYRNSAEPDSIHIVPLSASHSAAWHAVMK